MPVDADVHDWQFVEHERRLPTEDQAGSVLVYVSVFLTTSLNTHVKIVHQRVVRCALVMDRICGDMQVL